MSKHPERPDPEALQQCLETLQQLIALADTVDDHRDEYEIFQAAQKLYKSVKKHRKYMRKQAEPRLEPAPDATSVRFVFPTPEEGAPQPTRLSDDVAIVAPASASQPMSSGVTGGDIEGPADEAPDRDALHPPPAKPRRGRCYMCNQRPDAFHETYASMCVACGTLNLHKRHQTADLSQRVALLTGGRVKIGFQVGLKLLRSGARLIVTTRFPHDAARRYASAPDFGEWSHRLQIYGLDLRHLPSLYELTDVLQLRLDRLDILIQNAAQTVRRPPAYYRHLMDFEQLPHDALPAHLRQIVARIDDAQIAQQPRQLPAPKLDEATTAMTTSASALHSLLRPITQEGQRAPRASSAQLSQIPLLPGDELHDEALFPEGVFDEDGQQEDRRERNSWTMHLAEVPGAELWEVHTINAMAPFLLLQRLTPLLQRDASTPAFAINVAAAEGQFEVSGRKPWRHPHTNMSKAALNMLTRTCAEQYAAQGIYLNSVDPGWVSYELPLQYVQEHARQGFKLPLDAVDGAARILAPIFEGVASENPIYGVLLKDFKPVPW